MGKLQCTYDRKRNLAGRRRVSSIGKYGMYTMDQNIVRAVNTRLHIPRIAHRPSTPTGANRRCRGIKTTSYANCGGICGVDTERPGWFVQPSGTVVNRGRQLEPLRSAVVAIYLWSPVSNSPHLLGNWRRGSTPNRDQPRPHSVP